MREPKPFFRKQTKCWYVQFGKVQTNLGPDEKAARDEYHRLMTLRQDATPGPKQTVYALLNLYLTYCQLNLSSATYKKNLRHLRSFAGQVGRSLKPGQLKPYHVQQWADAFFAGKSSTYANIGITAVKGALAWANQQGYIDTNPIAKLRKPTAQIRETVVPSVKWQSVIDSASDGQFRDYLTFALDTGARPIEMRTIEARFYEAALKRFVFPRLESKGKKRERVIYLDRASLEIALRRIKQSPDGKLFRNSDGNPWTKDAINCRFQRMRKRLKMPGLCATTLRHSYAHYLQTIERKGIEAVRILMGHTDTRMLSTRYGHAEQDFDFVRDAARKGDLFAPVAHGFAAVGIDPQTELESG